MVAQIKTGAAMMLLIWMMFCLGLMVGVSTGFSADSAENATIKFDTESGNLTANGTTSNLWHCDEECEERLEEQEMERQEETPDWLLEAEENVDELLPEADLEEAQLIEGPDVVEAQTQEFVNNTVEFGFRIAMDAANPTSQFVYEHRDHPWMIEEVVEVLVFAIFLAPFIALFWSFARRLFG